MALQIPIDFDVHTQQLDDNEKFIRDKLNLQIENWARFRYTINVGNRANNLHSHTVIADDVKAAYRELGKSHYEVVKSLGYARLSLIIVDQSLSRGPLLLFTKSLKDCYVHIGCLLDNLARLIFIINDPKSTTRTNRRRLIRHWVGWGGLDDYPGYTRLKSSRQLQEIRNIRNTLTHSWSCPIHIESGVPHWPLAVRTERDHLWLYDELQTMRRRYRRWLPLLPMIESDFQFIESFQNKVFGKLVRDVRKFEQNYGVEIR